MTVTAFAGSEQRAKHDDVVTEEPLELRLVTQSRTQTLAVTMRTPGHDFELAAGFVTNEGIVPPGEHIERIGYCIDPAVDAEQRYNIVNVHVRTVYGDLARFERHFTMNSSCGVCGRANLEALREMGVEPVRSDIRIPIALLYSLPEKMRATQRVFSDTGGLHAAALFDESGTILVAREDIGRHNAVDKTIGWARIERRLPLSNAMLLVSGRTSYEILQKAAVAGIPVVCAVSAPSSLAVDLARSFNITLVGFLREERANIYSAPERITQ
ncbi:MAG: formate dehydrogenase accessory sulfurtransferase FdhD [Vulcanimicrobiaceae bacterium]